MSSEKKRDVQEILDSVDSNLASIDSNLKRLADVVSPETMKRVVAATKAAKETKESSSKSTADPADKG